MLKGGGEQILIPPFLLFSSPQVRMMGHSFHSLGCLWIVGNVRQPVSTGFP